MVYIFTWFVVLVTSIVLFKRASGTMSLLKPNMISITFYYSLFVTCFIGALLIVLHIDQHYMIARLRNDEYRLIGFYLLNMVMILMPLVMVIVSNLVGFNGSREFHQYIGSPVKKIEQRSFYFIFLALSLVSFLAIAYTFLKIGKIPLLEVLKGNTEVAELRIEASRNFRGNTLIRNIFAIHLTTVLSLVAYVYATVTKELKWKLLFFALFAGAVLINLYDLAKAPIFFYVLMFILVRIYIGKTVLTVKKLIPLVSAAVLGLIVMYVFVQGDTLEQFLSFNTGPIGRMILSQVAGLYLHLDLFGATIDFLQGRSLPSTLTSLYQLDHVRSARIAMEFFFPERIEAGTGGVMNTIFIAEAYANFGYLGVFLGTIYVAALIQIIYILFVRLPKDPILLGLFVYFTVNIPRTIVGGFADFLFNPLWIAITVFLVGSLLFIKFYEDLKDYVRRARKHYQEEVKD